MIKRLTVTKLNDSFDYDLTFSDDLNILTGRNGAGKTTVMKLLWYTISGNLERIAPEISFESFGVETSDFKIEARKAQTRKGVELAWRFSDSPDEPLVDIPDQLSPESSGNRVTREYPFSELRKERVRVPPGYLNADYLNRIVVAYSSGSLFFPTFRRIEGGFGLGESRATKGEAGGVEDALRYLSSRLSNKPHKFIAAISARDISDELASRYAEIAQAINLEHSNLSKRIIEQIGEYSHKPKSEREARKVLDSIGAAVQENDKLQSDLLKPFTALSDLVSNVFRHRGIRVAPGIALGEAEEAISSEALSAGEKQMLSFLAYNAFTRDSVIFFDEPETSLHVDWQRILFPTLLAQGVNNQFIVATHSPFIYTKFEDKELMLDEDRG